MDFLSFSRYLLESGDIDPDYIFIREYVKKLKLSKTFLFNWICLKVVVYNSVNELHYLIHEVPFSKLQFGAERRKSKHFAQQYNSALIKEVSKYGSPEKFVCHLQEMPNPLDGIKLVNGYGPWAAWKFIDLLDCCAGYDFDLSKVDFRKAYVFPLKGLLMVNNMEEDVKLLDDDKIYHKCMDRVNFILKSLGKVKTPNNGFKGVRINEVETLLCKYHSYMHGHYYPGEDIVKLMGDIKSSPYTNINKFPNIW